MVEFPREIVHLHPFFHWEVAPSWLTHVKPPKHQTRCKLSHSNGQKLWELHDDGCVSTNLGENGVKFWRVFFWNSLVSFVAKMQESWTL